MEAEHKKLLINNFSFIGFFALLFICYCTVTSWLVGNTDLSQSASLDVRQKKVIVIDPGHGGEDGGAIGINGTLEKDLNLLISADLSELFQFAGYEVIPTRTEDIMLYDKSVNHIGRKKVLDLAARLEIAKNAMPDLFVGIHMNSFPQEKYSGLTVYYSDKTQESSQVAEALRQDVRSYLQPDNNREIKPGRNIYLLERSSFPAILVECGFLSNRQECELLSTEEYRQKLTFVIFSSLASFLEETKA